MTNTLHRYGRPEDFRDDFIVFIRSSKGRNDIGSVPKLKAFLRTALRHRPVTISQYRLGFQGALDRLPEVARRARR